MSNVQREFYEYEPAPDSYDSVMTFAKDHDRIISLHFHTTSVARDWIPLEVDADIDEQPGQVGDFPSLADFSSIPIFSARGWEALKPLIGYCCEALPIRHPSGAPYFLINVLEMIAALDEKHSIVDRNSVTGRVSRVIKYRFHQDKIKGKHIFKLPLQSGAGLIVDSAFRDAVEKAGLRGLIFRPLPMK